MPSCCLMMRSSTRTCNNGCRRCVLHAAAGVEEEAGHVLTVAQVQRMGHCLLGALLQLQHYGAIDKTAEGFQMVIKRCSLHFRACSKHVLTSSPGADPCAFCMQL